MRAGAEFFTEPSGSAQRRYEAMRAYFVDEQPAARRRRPVRVLHRQRAPDGHAAAIGPDAPVRRRQARPQGPDQGHRAGAGEGASAARPAAAGHRDRAASSPAREPRSPRRPSGRSATPRACPGSAATTPPARGPATAAGAGQGRRPGRLAGRAAGAALRPRRAAAAGPGHDRTRPARADRRGAATRPPASYRPGTRSAPCCWPRPPGSPRAHHIDKITDDEGLAFFLGLTALPKATHLSTYSYRARRESSQQLLTGLIRRLRALGLAAGEEGFNLDFHAIRHHGDDPVLEEHYVPARSQRTRSGAHLLRQRPRLQRDGLRQRRHHQDRASPRDHRLRRLLAGCHRADPGLLVFDSQLTTYKILEELSRPRITWLTLRQRGKAELARLAALPASAWKRHTIDRAGRYRHPHLHEDQVTLKGISAPVRQIAIKNIGRDQPTLLITNDSTPPRPKTCSPGTPSGCSSRTSSTPTSPASTSTRCRRPFRSTSTWTPRSPSSPATSTGCSPAACRATPDATPDTIWRHFLDDTGTLHITPDGVTADLTLRSHHPVLIDAGFADLEVPIPWWDGRPLRFRFPPR